MNDDSSEYRLNESGYMQHRFDPKRYQHRDVWIAANGPIPADCHIHHKNKIRHDNRLENLECMEKSEHLKLHGLTFKIINSWNARKARKESRPQDCWSCDKYFETFHVAAKFCSKACRQKYHNWLQWAKMVSERDSNRVELSCPTCKKVFMPTESHQIYCNKRCMSVTMGRRRAARLGHKPSPERYRACLANG